MRQLAVRTVRRRLGRQELWNGDREAPLRTLLTDPGHVLRWAWAAHPRTGPRVLALAARRPDLVVVRLTSRADVRRWERGPVRALGG